MPKRLYVRRLPEGAKHLILHMTNRHIRGAIVDKMASTTDALISTESEALRRRLYNNEMTSANLGSYKTATTEAARLVGEAIGERAVEKGITTLYFERKYSIVGKAKAFLDAVISKGIKVL
ncbi:50S ribosomal protein L18 [Porphyridium purpureum]|uniref:50S ribosomal protein L18 n=1 Tax=Porphyridium purpureum TaxID=35688 RepID=A0A5J4Z536_PORPP|nr:50S ribosomal protein L18 [Porphyridium purpureum]|eukprot:POR2863..scf295_1